MATEALMQCITRTEHAGHYQGYYDDSSPQWLRDAVETARDERGAHVMNVVVEMQCIYGDTARDADLREYASATPSGEMTLVINNPRAAAQFVPGEEYVVIIRPRRPQMARDQGDPLDAQSDDQG